MKNLTEIKKFDVLPGTSIEKAVEEGLKLVKIKLYDFLAIQTK